MTNICTRCGKDRISSKTWQEVVEAYGRTTIITHTEFVCANADCQKIVERQLLELKKRRELFESRKNAPRNVGTTTGFAAKK